jgi:predicted DNA-binding protein
VATHAITEQSGPPLTLRYTPDAGPDADVDAYAFAEYIQESIRALRQTAEILAGHNVNVRYVVNSLRKRSPAVVSIRPVASIPVINLITRAQKTHVETLRSIKTGVVPRHLDYPAIQTYKRIGDLNKRFHFVTEVKTDGEKVTAGADIKNRLDVELARDTFSHESARGWIRHYHAAGKRRLIRLYSHTGRALSCSFRERDQKRVRELIDQYVEVEGLARYRPNAYQPYHLEIKEIDELRGLENSPSFEDMRGFAPRLAEGMTAEQYVREQRSGW